MILETIIGSLASIGISNYAQGKTNSPATTALYKPPNVDRTIIGYDVLSGKYTPLPVDSTAEGFVNSMEDINKVADYDNGEWSSNVSVYDAPGLSGGVNIPYNKVSDTVANNMVYQGYDITNME